MGMSASIKRLVSESPLLPSAMILNSSDSPSMCTASISCKVSGVAVDGVHVRNAPSGRDLLQCLDSHFQSLGIEGPHGDVATGEIGYNI